MSQLTRRDFIRTSLVGAGALAAAPCVLRAAETQKAGLFCGNELVAFGRTGIKASRLAFGTGFNGYNRSSELTRAGKKAFDRAFRYGLDQGINFIDMADLYGSHPFVKDVIKDLPRDKVVLLSKLAPRKESWVTPSGGAKPEVERFCKELGVDRLDVCLIHCMMNDKWPTEFKRIRDELSELKDKGIIRAAGVSCHDLGALRVAAKHPWVDVIFARVNDRCGPEFYCDGSVEEVSDALKTARANGKAVVGMKIFGAGKLVKPEQKDASLSFVFNHGLVDAITIGMLKREQVDDTLLRMSRVKAVA
jgi:1-deoxyxylulose-5-phosphate synthase